jgi:hypothetical protein
LVLAGVAVSFIVMAAANGLIFLGDPRATHTVVFWMLGGLGLAQWSQLLYPLVILLACGAWLMSAARAALNAMTVGDETASTLGIPVARFRLIVFVVGALDHRRDGRVLRHHRLCRPDGPACRQTDGWRRLSPCFAGLGSDWCGLSSLGRHRRQAQSWHRKTCPSASSPAWSEVFSLFGSCGEKERHKKRRSF